MLLDELIGGAHLGDAATVHNDYGVVVGDCIESMGHCDYCGVAEFLFYNVLNEGVGLHVYVGGGFIEDEDSATTEEGTGEA